jgi:hypothetical protein
VNVNQWFDTSIELLRLKRYVARLIGEVNELLGEVAGLLAWKGKIMAVFEDINTKLDTIVAGQEAAAVAAGEIAADINDLKDLIANQNQGGLSEGQTNAVATKLDQIAASAAALQTSLAATAAIHTPATPPPPPPDEPPAPI